ncbi:E3 ubiquitin-protein ligase RBBP6 [Drosophila tropicalis]|uniref:E3 ubiquitin-protein ligase RBBP6 n=1 Tax=Drosophila tropicalis TaxID=46794 RepID=UPI0035AB7BBA
MSVHYKFKSTLHFDTITFDGLHISVGDLKREIIQQKKLGKIIDFDLQITNAQSKEEYKDDSFLIPKNTTLIISRIPIAHPTKKGWEPPSDNAFSSAPTNKQDNFNMDLSKMQGSEEEKIQAMMMQSTADYDPKTYHRIKGQSQVGEVPASYRCNKCKKSGHWIKNCPYILGKEQYEVKRNTGIPRSFRDKPDMAMDQDSSKFVLPVEQNQEIPEDLICGICRDIFVDAVMIPCCGSSFCDDCVRTSLLESEDSECPDCKEKNCSPGSLIPNRFLRNSVNAFKSETGYTLKTDKKVEKPPVESTTTVVAQPSSTDKVEAKPEAESSNVNGGEENGKSVPSVSTNNVDQSQKEKEKEKNDSDYEDNITIKMPQKVEDTTPAIAPKVIQPYIGSKPSGDSVSHRREQNQEFMMDHDMKPRPPPAKLEGAKHHERSLLPTPVGIHQNFQCHVVNEPEDTHRIGVYKQSPYIQAPRLPPLHMVGHQMPPYNNGYNNMGQRPPMNFNPYQPQNVHSIRPQFEPTGNINMNPMQRFQSPSLASIYQGVAAKVGSGLIDDPLEAFNRIMKEKERQKEDRRRTSDHHRSRSPDRLRHRYKSPAYDKNPPRDLNFKEKRPRSRDRKREYSHERRPARVMRHACNGSKSPNDKNKRSGHRRSPSPRVGYKADFKEKQPHNKPYGSKIEPVEPPPPGFESSHITEHEQVYKKQNKNSPEVPIIKHVRGSQSIEDDMVPRKRHRSNSKSRDSKQIDNCYRSPTPPPKAAFIDESYKHISNSPKTPEKLKNPYVDVKMLSNSPKLNLDILEACNTMGKENKIKLNLQLKERKKKKKDKSERKKNKKDKKEKKDKSKKGYSPDPETAAQCSTERESATLNVLGKINSKPDTDIGHGEFSSISNEINQNISESMKPDQLKNYSILDIEGREAHCEEMNKAAKFDAIQMSKWELEDNNLSVNISDPFKKLTHANAEDNSEITSDVIRKAENAIFAKAINAIRPVEFQVVINSKGSSKDRSVSIKGDPKDRGHSPKRISSKSVKDRLGSKVVHERNYSPDRSRGKSGMNERSAMSVRSGMNERSELSERSVMNERSAMNERSEMIEIEEKFLVKV